MGWINPGTDSVDFRTPSTRALDEAESRVRDAEERLYKAEADLHYAEKNLDTVRTIVTCPPTDAEISAYAAQKQSEARAFIDDDDPDFPTLEVVRNLNFLEVLNARDFLEFRQKGA